MLVTCWPSLRVVGKVPYHQLFSRQWHRICVLGINKWWWDSLVKNDLPTTRFFSFLLGLLHFEPSPFDGGPKAAKRQKWTSEPHQIRRRRSGSSESIFAALSNSGPIRFRPRTTSKSKKFYSFFYFLSCFVLFFPNRKLLSVVYHYRIRWQMW